MALRSDDANDPTAAGYRDALAAAHERIAILEGTNVPRAPRPSRFGWSHALAAFGLTLLIVGGSLAAYVVAAGSHGVRLTGMLSNAGWLLYVQLPTPTRKLSYRLPDDRSFTEVSPPIPALMSEGTFRSASVTVPIERVHGVTPIEIRFVDIFGRVHTTTASFDPTAQVVSSTKATLGMIEAAWVSFHPNTANAINADMTRGSYLVYFTTLLAYKPALRDIQYSVDSDALDQRIAFTASDKLGVAATDQMFLTLAKRPTYIAVKLVYIDGSESTLHRYTPSAYGDGASTLPNGVTPQVNPLLQAE